MKPARFSAVPKQTPQSREAKAMAAIKADWANWTSPDPTLAKDSWSPYEGVTGVSVTVDQVLEKSLRPIDVEPRIRLWRRVWQWMKRSR